MTQLSGVATTVENQRYIFVIGQIAFQFIGHNSRCAVDVKTDLRVLMQVAPNGNDVIEMMDPLPF